MGSGKSKPQAHKTGGSASARKARRTVRRRKALDFRVMGWTYVQIARELRCDTSTAWRMVKEALALEDEETIETAKEHRAYQLKLIEKMNAAMLPKALALDPKTLQPIEGGKPCEKAQHQVVENLKHASNLGGLNRQIDPDEGVGLIASIFAEAARLAERRDAEEAEAEQ